MRGVGQRSSRPQKSKRNNSGVACRTLQRSNGPTNLQNAPCVRIDRAGHSPHSHRDFVVEVVNALTEQIDGMQAAKVSSLSVPATILAATIPLCAAKFPVLARKYPVLRNIFPANLRRELCEKPLRHSGFLP